MSKRKQTPVFSVTIDIEGMTKQQFTSSKCMKESDIVTCTPLNRQAFRVANKVEGHNTKKSVYGKNYFTKKAV